MLAGQFVSVVTRNCLVTLKNLTLTKLFLHVYQMTERIGVAVTLVICVREVLGSNLGRNTG
jgi:hypothetical protein